MLLNLKEKLSEMVKLYPGMREVEALIRTKFDSESQLLREIPEYLLSLGGKRIRPLLSLVCARALGMSAPSPALIDVSAGIELIHMATLLHDDIIDKSPVRRHQQSAFIKYGIPNTLLCGDFLLVRAFSLCAKLDQFIIEQTERACVELTEGEIEELPLYQRNCSLSQYIEIARKKTAALFRLATVSAAHLATNQSEISANFASFGESLGIAFQIIDDILDVSANEEQLGKKIGQDIKEQKPTAVNLIWADTKSALSQRLFEADGFQNDQLLDAAIKEIRMGDVLPRCRELAASYLKHAEQALELGCGGWQKLSQADLEGLKMIINYAVQRAS